MRLKSELAFLVDTELWARCLADVRAREKVSKGIDLGYSSITPVNIRSHI